MSTKPACAPSELAATARPNVLASDTPPIILRTGGSDFGRSLAALDADRLRDSIAAATPFPHVVFDMSLDPSLAEDFPDLSWTGWNTYRDAHQHGKRICSRLTTIPRSLRDVVEELHTSETLTWLENVTGIAKLLVDPHLEGSGLHASGPGGTLGTHTDFHLYRRLDLHRRINLLVYLNPGWTSADGGSLQLFAKGSKTPAVEVVPTFGRVVIFETSSRSPHGFRDPVVAGKVRQSIALYYYTAAPTPNFSGDQQTEWLHAPKKGTTIRRGVHGALRQFSRIVSVGAHIADPNRGLHDLIERRQVIASTRTDQGDGN